MKIKFALKPKLTVNKLSEAFDECNLLIPPSLTKKSNLDTAKNDDDPLQPDNDGTPRHQIGTTICKCFDNIEHKREIAHCDHHDQPCEISCSDGDREQMRHNEVKSHLHSTTSPWKVKKQHINQIVTKLSPTELDADSHSLELDIATIQAITAVSFGDAAAAASDEEIQLCIQTLGSDSATPEEQALGRFTRQKLKSLSNWNVWKKGEHKQLNQLHKQSVFGNPIDPATFDPDSIILSPTWQCAVKQDRTRRSRLCCDGSKRAAPVLHVIASTWSSCVEMPIQRLFPALCAAEGHCTHGENVQDAHAHAEAHVF